MVGDDTKRQRIWSRCDTKRQRIQPHCQCWCWQWVTQLTLLKISLSLSPAPMNIDEPHSIKRSKGRTAVWRDKHFNSGLGKKRQTEEWLWRAKTVFSLVCQNVIYRHTSIHPVAASFHILWPQISLANWIGNMWAASSIKSYSELGHFPAHFNKSWL